jgi:anti-sigma regulatory factor (Ser/Thr protein kinase)
VTVGEPSSRQLRALLAVGRAVAHARDVTTVLDRIAKEAAHVVRAEGASILLVRVRNQPFHVAGAFRLGEAYRTAIEKPSLQAWKHAGPPLLAIEGNEQIVVENTSADARYSPWRRVARAEGYKSIVSTPLVAPDHRVIGTLDTYRAREGPWAKADLQMLSLFAQHAASAIQAARLIDRQRHQVEALRRVVGTMREQSHEHANRLHTIAGLLALGEYASAHEFVQGLAEARRTDQREIIERIRQPTICALLIAQTGIAEQRGISFKLSPKARLSQLPPSLDEAGAVTILGNLVDNAFDAVANVAERRRQVVVSFVETSSAATWRVRDHGGGIPASVRTQVLRRGYSRKAAHDGIGLYLVADTVARSRGELRVRHHKEGTSFSVVFPRD